NATQGGYSVSASAGSLGAAAFVLTNTAPASFNLAANPAAVTIAAGESGSVGLTVTPVNGYAGTIALSCTGLPAGAGCGFAPASVQVGGGAPAQVAMTIATVATAGLVLPGAAKLQDGRGRILCGVFAAVIGIWWVLVRCGIGQDKTWRYRTGGARRFA